MKLSLEKKRVPEERRANSARADISEFLMRKLPPQSTSQTAHLTEALLAAGARYDRYAARKHEWTDYTARKSRLRLITKLMDGLADRLSELDLLSRDDLATRIGEEKIEAHIGSLRFLSRETTDLAKGVQRGGRRRDLAEERWMLELADIYENYFGRPAKVWGSGDGDREQRGSFYRMLEVSQPASFPRNRILSLRQINRVLKRRKPVKGI